MRQLIPTPFQIPLVMFLLGACTDEPQVTSDEAPLAQTEDGDIVYPDDPNTPNGVNICKTITVSGNVFYNDLRSDGRFRIRRTPRIDGTVYQGSRHPFSSSPGAENKNYLGLLDATVKLYEVDNTGPFEGCHDTSYIAKTTVRLDGGWTWTGQVCDACRDDREGADDHGISIAAKVVLESCEIPNSRCFSVRDPEGAPTSYLNHYNDNWDGPVYERWIRGASNSSPVVIQQGTTVDIGTDYFQASGSQTSGVVTDLDAQAANVFASAVDVTRKLHFDNNVAFAPVGGKVMFYFPDVIGWSHSHQNDSNRVCINAPGVRGDEDLPVRVPTRWFDGSDAAHEYGHLVNFWQWDGNGKWVQYDYDADGDGHVDKIKKEDDGTITDKDGDGDNVDEEAESSSTREYANAALKEGWANFVQNYTFDGTGSPDACDDNERDRPQECAGPATCTIGRHYIGDVAKTLCDMVDSSANTESGDTVAVSVRTMTDTLREMWVNSPNKAADVAGASRTFPTNSGFGVCDVAKRLVNRGTTTTTVMRDMLAQTLLDCGL